MAEYPSNSFKSKEEQKLDAREKRVQKVVRGGVKTRQNKGRKLTDIFISEDASNVKSYIAMDVLVPAFKKLIFDIFTDGIEMILYGSKGSKSGKSGSKISYRSYYDEPSDNRSSRATTGRFDYEDIIYDSRGEAEIVLKNMNGCMKRFGMVTVADMYDLSGLTAPHTAFRYGWMSIRNASVKRVRDGYIIDLPKATMVD
jgi:hypothetical protein